VNLRDLLLKPTTIFLATLGLLQSTIILLSQILLRQHETKTCIPFNSLQSRGLATWVGSHFCLNSTNSCHNPYGTITAFTRTSCYLGSDKLVILASDRLSPGHSFCSWDLIAVISAVCTVNCGFAVKMRRYLNFI
jgi:hypothetical protein